MEPSRHFVRRSKRMIDELGFEYTTVDGCRRIQIVPDTSGRDG